MLAHNALLAQNGRVSFVLEQGYCVFQQGDSGQQGAQGYESKKMTSLLTESFSPMVLLIGNVQFENMRPGTDMEWLHEGSRGQQSQQI